MVFFLLTTRTEARALRTPAPVPSASACRLPLPVRGCRCPSPVPYRRPCPVPWSPPLRPVRPQTCYSRRRACSTRRCATSSARRRCWWTALLRGEEGGAAHQDGPLRRGGRHLPQDAAQAQPRALRLPPGCRRRRSSAMSSSSGGSASGARRHGGHPQAALPAAAGGAAAFAHLQAVRHAPSRRHTRRTRRGGRPRRAPSPRLLVASPPPLSHVCAPLAHRPPRTAHPNLSCVHGKRNVQRGLEAWAECAPFFAGALPHRWVRPPSGTTRPAAPSRVLAANPRHPDAHVATLSPSCPPPAPQLPLDFSRTEGYFKEAAATYIIPLIRKGVRRSSPTSSRCTSTP